jgi:hypothetical protein
VAGTLRTGWIAVAVAVAVTPVAVLTSGPLRVPVSGLPVAMHVVRCASGGSIGADILWIRGSGFETPEAALTAGIAREDAERFDPALFSKRYVRLGGGPHAGLGAEFTQVRADGDHPYVLVLASWSHDGGWLVRGYSMCAEALAPGTGGHGVSWRP